MGTAFAGIVRTPLTSVIMVFELTRDYTIIVPLMISNLIAYFISYKLQREPIYEALAHQEGVHLPTAESRSESRRMRVSQAMRPPSEVLPPDATVREALERMRGSALEAWPIVDDAGFCGMARTADLESAAAQGLAGQTLADLVDDGLMPQAPGSSHLYPDHALGRALERMGASGEKVPP